MTSSQVDHRAGLVIVGHGTRDPRGCAEFSHLVARVAASAPEIVVEGCFLELAEPDMAEGFRRAIDRGASRLAVVPLLLVAAGHARRDIPQAVAAAAARYPAATIRQTPHLGAHDSVLRLAGRRHQEALQPRGAQAPQDTMLLVVGRGTNDPDANAELVNFARRHGAQTQAGRVETCFLAMTEPSLAQALETLPELPYGRIVVQPHFLFQGELLARVHNLVDGAAARRPDREFVITERLGADELLVAGVLALAEECLEDFSTPAAEQSGQRLGG